MMKEWRCLAVLDGWTISFRLFAPASGVVGMAETFVAGLVGFRESRCAIVACVGSVHGFRGPDDY